jgi:Ala-tRNA(Pro) deacylase
MQATVREMLEKKGAHIEVLHHPPAYSGEVIARVIGIQPDAVLKAIVLDTRGGHALAVLPASRDIDMHRLRDAVGDAHVHLATEKEIRRDLPEYELGAVPPFGSLTGMTMYVDGEVLAHPSVAFAAGKQTETLKGPTAEVFAGETATVAPLTDWERDIDSAG